MTVAHIDVSPELKRTGRRVGYGIAVVVNLVMLIVVQNILDWGWLPFLTEDFELVIPWISFSLLASIVANLVYQFEDRAVVKSTGQVFVNLISLIVTYRIYQVFPFDFSTTTFDWELVTRILLILAMVGSGVGMITEALKLASGAAGAERR